MPIRNENNINNFSYLIIILRMIKRTQSKITEKKLKEEINKINVTMNSNPIKEEEFIKLLFIILCDLIYNVWNNITVIGFIYAVYKFFKYFIVNF